MPGRPTRSAIPRPRRTTALWLGGSVALLLAVGLLAARPTPIVGVDGDALQYSVDGGSIVDLGPCPHEEDDTWTCSVNSYGDSSTVTYRVKVGGLGCWTAVSTEPIGAGRPQRLTGCIDAWDQVRFFDRLL